MPKIQFDVNANNAVAVDAANDILPLWWMKAYPFGFNQSKSLFHADIKWYVNISLFKVYLMHVC